MNLLFLTFTIYALYDKESNTLGEGDGIGREDRVVVDGTEEVRTKKWEEYNYVDIVH